MADTASVSVGENSTAVTTLSASDPDAGATLSYTIVGGADQARFTISPSGVLSFAAAPDFETPSDAGANNVYDVAVQVSDGLGGIDVQTLSVTVTNANEAPVIAGGATASVSVAENGTAVTTVSASDPDAGAVLSYAIVGGADQAKFTISSSGVLSSWRRPTSRRRPMPAATTSTTSRSRSPTGWRHRRPDARRHGDQCQRGAGDRQAGQRRRSASWRTARR